MLALEAGKVASIQARLQSMAAKVTAQRGALQGLPRKLRPEDAELLRSAVEAVLLPRCGRVSTKPICSSRLRTQPHRHCSQVAVARVCEGPSPACCACARILRPCCVWGMKGGAPVAWVRLWWGEVLPIEQLRSLRMYQRLRCI